MTTKNPFPGMNPFFEQQWRDAHTRLREQQALAPYPIQHARQRVRA